VTNLVEYMVDEHEFCNDLFCEAENLATESKWVELKSVFEKFATETENHFGREEKVLFPCAEQKMGSQGGPTAVMRMEHEQMRALIGNLRTSIDEENKTGFLGETETLLVLMQQHNMKEEQILYPMLDRLLAGELETVFDEMKRIGS
jgi:hemerythrin-like domain-containing protein